MSATTDTSSVGGAPPPPAVGPRCPFVGLAPFGEMDEAFFFGRDRQAAIIADNLLAFRLTLLYGPSGVGKSSVLRAAVLPHLRRRAAQHAMPGEPPEFRVAMFSSWRDDPVPALRQCLHETLATPLPAGSSSLHDALRHVTSKGSGDVLLVLDQFDEYFVYHADLDDPFTDDLAEVINDAELGVNILISIRDDSLYKLDRFKGRVPGLFSNYLRVDHLSADAAREAIIRPVAVYNETAEPDERMTVEPALVDAVLEQVRTAGAAGAAPAEAALAESAEPIDDRRVEAAHLQIVLTRLWGEELAQHSRTLRRTTFDALGGADAIIRSHLDEAMAVLPDDQQDLAGLAFRHLVTPSGSKIALSAGDLASYARVDAPAISAVLERLCASEARILRSVPPAPGHPGETRYEIFHDVLGPAVTDWRRRRDSARETQAAERALREERASAARQLRAAHRRIGLMAGVAIVMTVLLVVASVFIVRFQREQAESESRRQAAEAMDQLSTDPAGALQTALGAMRVRGTDQAERALRLALGAAPPSEVLDRGDSWFQMETSAGSEVIATIRQVSGDSDEVRVWHAGSGGDVSSGPLVRPRETIWATAVAPSGEMVATVGLSTVTVWSATSGEQVSDIAVDATAVEFSPNSEFVVAGTSSGDVGVWDAATGHELQLLPGAHDDWVTAVSLDEDGTMAVTASNDGTAMLWDLTTGQGTPLDSGYSNPVIGAVVSPDGTRAVTTDGWGDSYLWDTGQPAAPIGKFEHGVRVLGAMAAELSPDGRLVAVIADKEVELYNTDDGEIVGFLSGHRDAVSGVAFDRTGQRMVTASLDGTARVWDLPSSQTIAVLPIQNAMIDAAFVPGGGGIVTVSGDGVRLWRLPHVRELAEESGGWYFDAAFSPDGSIVAAANRGSGLAVWALDDGDEPRPLDVDGPTDGTMYDVAFSPDGTHVATAVSFGTYGTVGIWEIEADRADYVADVPQRWSSNPTVGYAPESGDLVIAASEQVYVWDGGPDSEPTAVLPNEIQLPDRIVHAALAPDGDTIVLARQDTVVGVDRRTGEPLWDEPLDVGAQFVAMDASGERAALIEQDWNVEIIDVATGETTTSIGREQQGSQPTTVAFSRAGLLIGSNDGSVNLWRLPGPFEDDPAVVFTSRHHGSYVNSVQLSPDGRQVLSAADDGRVLLWTPDVPVDRDELIGLAEGRIEAGSEGGGGER